MTHQEPAMCDSCHTLDGISNRVRRCNSVIDGQLIDWCICDRCDERWSMSGSYAAQKERLLKRILERIVERKKGQA